MPSTKLSKYFSSHEVGKSQTAARLGIDNKPPTWVLDNARELAVYVLDAIREEFGPLSPQSWYRGEELEKALTWEKGFRHWCAGHNRPWLSRKSVSMDHPLKQMMGVQQSWEDYFQRKSHPKGQAVDIEIPGVDNDKLFFWIKEHLAFDQLIREFPKPSDPASGWVHVSWAGTQANRQAFFSIPYYDRYA